MVPTQDIFAIRVDKSHDSEDKGPLDFFEEVACSRISFDYSYLPLKKNDSQNKYKVILSPPQNVPINSFFDFFHVKYRLLKSNFLPAWMISYKSDFNLLNRSSSSDSGMILFAWFL